jgi:Holliday junction resolvasome RuvABC endonuclease subunit
MYFVGIDTSLNHLGISLLKYDHYSIFLLDYYHFNLNKIENINSFFKMVKIYNKKYKPKYIIEKVFPMKISSRKSIFNFAYAYGIIKGILYITNSDFIELYPQRWKKLIGITSIKETSIEKFKEIFTNWQETNFPIKNDHIIESTLIVISFLIDNHKDKKYLLEKLKGEIKK